MVTSTYDRRIGNVRYQDVIYDAGQELTPLLHEFKRVREELISAVMVARKRELLGPYQEDFERRVLRPLADAAGALEQVDKGLNWLANQQPKANT